MNGAYSKLVAAFGGRTTQCVPPRRLRPMEHLLLLALLCGPGEAGARAVAERWPSKTDAAFAYFEWEAEFCIKAIDVCDAGPVLRSTDRIERLRCVSEGAGTATCRFVTGSYRCKAHFVSPAAADDYARALSWRRRLPGPRPNWLLVWQSSPRLTRPRIDCSIRH